ncbi:MAG: DHA2 family efflux MFS transporter permease subunit [Sphingomonas sp.]
MNARPDSPVASVTGIVPWIVACALFMQSLDSTAIATAVPQMAHSLRVAPVQLSAAITSYILAVAVFLPMSGWLADRFGARRVFALAIVMFTLASVACGATSSLPQLVIARIVQGAGGSMMVPVGRLVLLRSIPREQLVRAMARMTMPALVGPAIGPVLGGFLATYASWRWIFLINIPIGLIGTILALKLIPDIREERHVAGPFDALGFVLSGVALGTLVFGLEGVGRHGSSGAPFGLIALGLASGGVYLIRARRMASPVLDVRLFRHPTYAAALLGGSLFRFGVGAVPFLMPMQLQVGFGLTAFASGCITFSGALGAILSKPFTSGVLQRLGFRSALALNGVLSGLILIGYGLFRPVTPHALIIAAMLIGGCMRSLQFTYMNTLAYAEIPQPDMSRANTLSGVMQQLSISMGVALAAATLQRSAGSHSPLPGDFVAPYLVVGLLSCASSLFFLRLHPRAGAEMSGHRPQIIDEPEID